MKLIFLALISLFFIRNAAASECDCDHIISGSVDAQELGVLPGDKICLDGGSTYDNRPLRWENFVGTAEDPIIIKNCNGVAHINPADSSYGWKFINSKHFKILGNGDPNHEYGIKVTTRSGFYLTMEYFTTDFEIGYIEIAGEGATSESNGFAGIGMKTSPYQDCELFQDETKTAFLMENVTVHHNFIHDIGGEGIYAGHGFYQGREERSRCPEGVTTYAHNIHNLAIYDNYITDVGYDGIQVKNADSHASINNNVIRNYGRRNEGSHDEGIFAGDGFEGVIHSNWVENGPGHGMQINAFGNTKIYNNVVINSGDDGIYLNNRSKSFANRDGVFEIHHNTFINMGDDGIEAYTPQRIDLLNNIFVNMADKNTNGFNADIANNLFEGDSQLLGFVDTDHNNYGLSPDSMAKDTGLLVSLQNDYSGTARVDGLPDLGAFESGSFSSAPAILVADDITANEPAKPGEVKKITLTPSMLQIINGNGDATRLIDEQALVGDPANGDTSDPTTYWKSTDGAKSLPHTARIDLSAEYHITEIYLYDSNGKGELVIEGLASDSTSWLVNDMGSRYNVWSNHEVNQDARFIDVTRYGQNNFNEIVLYGYLKDTVAPEITLLGDSSLQLRLNQDYIEYGALASDNLDGDISTHITVDTSSLNINLAGNYNVIYSVSDTSGNATQIIREVQIIAPKILLAPSMISLIKGNGEVANLVDEQELAGDPAAGDSFSPTTFWKPTDGARSLPQTAQIDLGTEYRISEIYLYDTNGKGDLELMGGTADAPWLVNDSGAKYNVWTSHTINKETRYINLTRYGQNNFNEIVIYGHPKEN
jgi:hypothetical protein